MDQMNQRNQKLTLPKRQKQFSAFTFDQRGFYNCWREYARKIYVGILDSE